MSFKILKSLGAFLAVIVSCSASIAQTQFNRILDPQEDEISVATSLYSRADKKISFGAMGSSYAEGPFEAQVIQALMTPTIDLPLSEIFHVRASATVSLNKGRVQARFLTPNTSNALNLNEVVGVLSPNKYFKIEAGAIFQNHLRAPMLIAGHTFPGAMALLGYENKKISFWLKYQYTIPTAFSLDTDRTETEALPEFQTAGVSTDWNPRRWFHASADVNYFDFGPLPSAIAFQSGLTGNQLNSNEPALARFSFDFRGLIHNYVVDWNYTPGINQFLELQIVDNQAAPENLSRSQWIAGGFRFGLTNFVIQPQFASFYAETDSSPSFYNSARLGHNNREGQLYGLRFDFTKLGFALESNYIEARLLQSNGVIQNDLRYLEVILEVAQVHF